eukprot:jgi/Psemu1/24161/gm1.24161_g
MTTSHSPSPGTHTDNDLKRVYAIQVVSVFVVVALLAGHVTVNFQLAFGIFVTYQLWGWRWIKILKDSPNIYAVRVPTTVMGDWIPISLPSSDGPKIRKNRVVTSISELSGIRGAQMMVSLRVMTATINMLVLVAIQLDLHHRKSTIWSIGEGNSRDMVPVCLLVLAIGFFATGHFELNMVDGLHTTGHYLGVTGIFLGSFCIGFALEWNLLSVFLLALEFGTCIYWSQYTARVVKKSDDLTIVTRNSKMCIGIELVMFYVTNTILVLTVYSLGPNEGNIWASPFLVRG